MNWKDVTTTPKPKLLRQFAGLWLLFFVGLAVWRAWHVGIDTRAQVLAAAGIVIGGLGLVQPVAIRWIYTGWMIAAFPIGWTISRVMLAVMFYGVFTPFALVFRALGRDALKLRRASVQSYWLPKTGATDVKEYFRQS